MQVILVVMGLYFMVRDGTGPKEQRISSMPVHSHRDETAVDSFDGRWSLYAPRTRRATSSLSRDARSMRSGVAPDERRPLLASPAGQSVCGATSTMSSTPRSMMRDYGTEGGGREVQADRMQV